MLPAPSSKQPRGPWRSRIIWLALICLVVVGLSAVPLEGWWSSPAQALRSAGPVAPLVYACVYTLWAFLALPTAVLTLLAGFVYGPAGGFLLAMPAATVAAAAHFVIVRRFGARWVAKKLRSRPRLATIHRATATHGLQLTLLLRASPIVPFSALNYVMAVSQVRFWHFIVGSVVGKAPVILLHVYLGSAASRFSDLKSLDHSTGLVGDVLFWGGLVATVLATVQLTRMARTTASRVLHHAEVRP